MLVLECSQTRYVIETRLSRWWLLATAIGLWLGASLILNGTITTLTCHRTESNEGQCEYSRRKLLDNNQQTFGLSHVTEATLYSAVDYTDKNGKQHLEYHVALVMDRVGSLEIYADTNESAQETLVNNINGYLANPGRVDLNVTRDESTGNAAIGLLIATCGLWWASVVLKTITYTFDKSVGTLTIQSRLIWTRLTTYSMRDVLGLYIHETESTMTRSNQPRTYRSVHIVLRGQEDIATALPADDEDLVHSLRLFLDNPHLP